MQDQETVEEDAQWERERRGDFSESKSYNAPASSSIGGFNDSDITPQASTETTEEEDDALSYFQKLAES